MEDMQAIKILVADGHAIVASGVAQVLGGIPDFQVIGQAKTGEEACRLFECYSPDVVSMDIELPGPISGLEVIRILRNKSPNIRVVVLTNLLEEMMIQDALQVGAISYLLKNISADELIQAIRSAYRGLPTLSPEVTQIVIHGLTTSNGYHLTSREHQVLELLVRGLNNHKIAKQLNISLSTVQFHVSNILNKLGVHNRIEATAFAIRHNLAG